MVGDLEIHYLELKKLSDCLDAAHLATLEEWLIFIKDAANIEKRELLKTITKRNEVIAMAEKILIRSSADELARTAYQQRRAAFSVSVPVPLTFYPISIIIC